MESKTRKQRGSDVRVTTYTGDMMDWMAPFCGKKLFVTSVDGFPTTGELLRRIAELEEELEKLRPSDE